MSEYKSLITFQPVPVRPRSDGWTVERQVAFVEKLADCGSISVACKHVGMSRESVRKLRRRPCGRGFRDACDAALDCSYAEVEEAAMERARNGVARPVFYKGEQVGEWRDYDERLTMFLLRFRRRHRFGPEADTLPRRSAGIPCYDPNEQIPSIPRTSSKGASMPWISRPSRRLKTSSPGWRASHERRPRTRVCACARSHCQLCQLPPDLPSRSERLHGNRELLSKREGGSASGRSPTDVTGFTPVTAPSLAPVHQQRSPAISTE